MYKLVISDTVEFPVKLSINDAGVTKEFPIRFEAKRVDVDTLRSTIDDHPADKLVDLQLRICRDNLTGWKDQRLVIDDNNQPAPFSADALECVLGITGAAAVIHTAYINAIVASSGTAGRAKN